MAIELRAKITGMRISAPGGDRALAAARGHRGRMAQQRVRTPTPDIRRIRPVHHHAGDAAVRSPWALIVPAPGARNSRRVPGGVAGIVPMWAIRLHHRAGGVVLATGEGRRDRLQGLRLGSSASSSRPTDLQRPLEVAGRRQIRGHPFRASRSLVAVVDPADRLDGLLAVAELRLESPEALQQPVPLAVRRGSASSAVAASKSSRRSAGEIQGGLERSSGHPPRRPHRAGSPRSASYGSTRRPGSSVPASCQRLGDVAGPREGLAPPGRSECTVNLPAHDGSDDPDGLLGRSPRHRPGLPPSPARG